MHCHAHGLNLVMVECQIKSVLCFFQSCWESVHLTSQIPEMPCCICDTPTNHVPWSKSLWIEKAVWHKVGMQRRCYEIPEEGSFCGEASSGHGWQWSTRLCSRWYPDTPAQYRFWIYPMHGDYHTHLQSDCHRICSASEKEPWLISIIHHRRRGHTKSEGSEDGLGQARRRKVSQKYKYHSISATEEYQAQDLEEHYQGRVFLTHLLGQSYQVFTALLSHVTGRVN